MLSSKTHFGKIDFNGGNLSSDGGAVLMMEYLEHIELIEQLRGIPFNDSRFLPVYSNTAIMFQCICRTLLGYHNQADQKVLLEALLFCSNRWKLNTKVTVPFQRMQVLLNKCP